MSAWNELVETLTESNKAMAKHEESYLKYVKARDEASTAFCLHSNRYGLGEALAAKVKARGESE